MGTLIKNGTIVTAADRYRADILIEGEKIAAIGLGLEGRAEQIIDATGRYVFPGGIDGHVHLGQLSSRGTDTTGMIRPMRHRGRYDHGHRVREAERGMSLLESVIRHREEKAVGRSAVDFSIHPQVTDPKKEIFEELPSL